MGITKQLIWTPQDGSTRLVANSDVVSHQLLVDESAGNGQQYSFDQWDEIVAVLDNNGSNPEEHTFRRTWPEHWRRFPQWAFHSDNTFGILLSTSSSSFKKVGGQMALKELWGVRYEAPSSGA